MLKVSTSKSRSFLRVTVDVNGDDLKLVDELMDSRLYPYKRDIFLTGLRLLCQLHRTRKAGGSVQHHDSNGGRVGEFAPNGVPVIIPFEIRPIDLAAVHEGPIRELLALSLTRADGTIDRICREIAAARWNPRDTRIQSDLLGELIICACSDRTSELLSPTLDLLTQLTTRFERFDQLVSYAIHPQDRPQFDLRFAEQRFLANRYDFAVRQKYGAA
jgi:hypothetical protein